MRSKIIVNVAFIAAGLNLIGCGGGAGSSTQYDTISTGGSTASSLKQNNGDNGNATGNPDNGNNGNGKSNGNSNKPTPVPVPAAPDAQNCPLPTTNSATPCGPFSAADTFLTAAQGDFYCVLDVTVGQVACEKSAKGFSLVANLNNANRFITGTENSYCASDSLNNSYCWEANSMSASLEGQDTTPNYKCGVESNPAADDYQAIMPVEPCGPFSNADGFESYLQGQLFMILDVNNGQVAAEFNHQSAVTVVTGIPDRVKSVISGDSTQFCVATETNDTYCFGADLQAVRQ